MDLIGYEYEVWVTIFKDFIVLCWKIVFIFFLNWLYRGYKDRFFYKCWDGDF